MTKIERFREQIDACRPDTADLSLAELAELAALVKHDREVANELSRSQAFDRAVSEALHDVPVPLGLADRLMAAMQTEAGPVVALAERSGSNEPDHATRRRFSRRQWWLIGGAVALATLLVAIALPFVRLEREIVQEELGLDVAHWLSTLNQPTSKWQPVAKVPLPKGMELDPAVNGTALRWQSFPVHGSGGWTGTVTAIDLRPAGQPRAMLFVVRSSAQFAVPARRMALSGGFAAMAWQRKDPRLLFVLVVEEDRGQRLEDFLRKAAQA